MLPAQRKLRENDALTLYGVTAQHMLDGSILAHFWPTFGRIWPTFGRLLAELGTGWPKKPTTYSHYLVCWVKVSFFFLRPSCRMGELVQNGGECSRWVGSARNPPFPWPRMKRRSNTDGQFSCLDRPRSAAQTGGRHIEFPKNDTFNVYIRISTARWEKNRSARG